MVISVVTSFTVGIVIDTVTRQELATRLYTVFKRFLLILIDDLSTMPLLALDAESLIQTLAAVLSIIEWD